MVYVCPKIPTRTIITLKEREKKLIEREVELKRKEREEREQKERKTRKREIKV